MYYLCIGQLKMCHFFIIAQPSKINNKLFKNKIMLQVDDISDDDADEIGHVSDDQAVLGSPPKRHKLSGLERTWEHSVDIVNFSTYKNYMTIVTKGGVASGPGQYKYTLYNKSRQTNDAGEHLHTIFRCASHEYCCHEVSLACL